MEVNFLEKFEANVNRFYFSGKTKDSFRFNKTDIQQAVQILKDFFGENYFKVNQTFSNKDEASLYANSEWIIYHLAQSETSIGSILVILEIVGIIHYFSAAEWGKQLLNSKLKPHGKVNELQIRSSLFELYVAKTLRLAGFKITTDEIDYSVNKDKRLDIIAEYEGEKYNVECMTFNEHEEEKDLIVIASYFTHTYLFLIDKYKTDFQVLKSLPVNGYLIIESKQFLRSGKNQFKELLKTYQKDIISTAKGVKKINGLYEIKEDLKFEICIEPFKTGLFESYTGLLDKKFLGIKFRVIPRRVGVNWELSPQIDIRLKHPKEEMEERIKKGIEDKRRQHHKSELKKKIFMFEYENYQGIRIAFDSGTINKERLKGNINENQIAFIIHKDSTQQDNISRNRILISKDENSSIFKKLNRINLTSFVEIV